MRELVLLIPLTLLLAAALPGIARSASSAPPPMRPADRRRIESELMRLDPETRVEQRCNARAMGVVRREHRPMNPDEGSVSAFAEPEVDGPRMRAEGAAIRSGGEWYRITYDCATRDNGLDIESFDYQLGEKVPKSEWKDHELVAP